MSPADLVPWTSLATAVVGGLTFLALLWYALETRRLRLTTEAALRLEMAPYVVPYFEVPFGTHVIDMVIKNSGRTPAVDVKLSFDPPLQNSMGEEIGQIPLFTKGISLLPPGFDFRMSFDASPAYLKNPALPREYTASVTYKDALSGRTASAKYVLDLGIYWGRMQIGKSRPR